MKGKNYASDVGVLRIRMGFSKRFRVSGAIWAVKTVVLSF